MRILHVSALPVWSMDGKGGMPSLQETLKGHLAAGHHLELVLPQYDPFSDDVKPLFVPEGQQLRLHFATCRWLPFFKKLRCQARRLGKNGRLPYGLRWVLNMFMLLALNFSLFFKGLEVCRRGFAPQLIYAHNQYAALPGFLLGRWFKVPNVTRLYGTFLADLMSTPFVSLRYPTAAAGYLVPSTLLICANDGTRGDEVARKFGTAKERFRFWQNGVEPPSEPPVLSRSDLLARFGGLQMTSKWAVSCSRLASWKRIDRMLQALAVCLREGAECQLVIAGDGPQKDNLQGLAKTLNIEKSVIWVGAVAHDDIWALMNTADVFMITNDVTNRCNPLYEAAWAGLPVLSVNDPSTSDLLHHRENALLAEKDDTEALGKLLAEICRDDQLRERLGYAQKKLSETFWTWEERMRVEVMDLEKIVTQTMSFKGQG